MYIHVKNSDYFVYKFYSFRLETQNLNVWSNTETVLRISTTTKFLKLTLEPGASSDKQFGENCRACYDLEN